MAGKAIIAQAEVEKGADGIVWMRQSASNRVWGGLSMVGIGAVVLVAAASGTTREGAVPIPLYLVALLFFGYGLWILSGKWAWQAAPGLLEREEEHFGSQRTWRFTEGSLVFRLIRGSRGGFFWQLSVESPGMSRTISQELAADRETWEGSEIGLLAHMLADATRFPLRDESGKVRYWCTDPVPGQAPGNHVQIRHLHTGLVMEQVAGGTLVGVHLAKALLEGADLQGADLRGADLSGAHLEGASLKDAKLANAALQGALLTAADLTGADLTGADLTGAKLIGATYDARTRWPAGFDPRQHGAVLAE